MDELYTEFFPLWDSSKGDLFATDKHLAVCTDDQLMNHTVLKDELNNILDENLSFLNLELELDDSLMYNILSTDSAVQNQGMETFSQEWVEKVETKQEPELIVPTNKPKVKRGTKRKIHECEVCHECFCDLDCLRNHRKIHCTLKCDFCSKTFLEPLALIIHGNIHKKRSFEHTDSSTDGPYGGYTDADRCKDGRYRGPRTLFINYFD